VTISSDTLDLLSRSGIDVLVMLILVGVLYRPQQSVASMPLVLTALNGGLFAALAAITSGDFAAGIGFGLFGLLSLLRLRSAAFTIKDVAYTFMSLILALVNGLPDRPLVLLGVINAALLLIVVVTDDTRSDPPTRVIRLILERAYSDPIEVRTLLDERLAVQIRSVVIDSIDYVRETTAVTVLYVADSDAPEVAGAQQLTPGSGAAL
jgi:Domain of unknown function (DUF4956)